MPQATFTPKYINPPKGNARSATIRDDQNGYWGIHPGDMHKFQAGVPVTVDYTQRTGQDGKTYWNVTAIVGQQAPANPQAQAQRGLNAGPPHPDLYKRQPQPNPQADPRKSEDIFVCGVVNHAIAHQSYLLDTQSLASLIQAARAAWRHGEPGQRMMMNGPDEPPFPGSPDDYGDVEPRG